MKKAIKSVLVLLAIASALTASAQQPSAELLSPTNHELVFIDFEGQMAFAAKSSSTIELRNNAALIAGASKIFNVATVVTTVAEKSFSGPAMSAIADGYEVYVITDACGDVSVEAHNMHMIC